MGKEKVVIIGGGFAGLNLIKKLDKSRFDVLLIDANNYHSFPPLFYQVASSGLDPSSICFPIRREMRKSPVRGASYQMGEVTKIDTFRRTVTTQYETVPYDRLVIAAGTTNNFFSSPDLLKRVFTLKSTTEALRCRNEILDRLERASITHDAEKRRRLLSFVVIGGGPTGVEIAGAIGEMKRYVIPREYPELNRDEVQVILVEGSQRLLHTMSTDASREASMALSELMVEVKLGLTMRSYDDNLATLSDGSEIYTEMLIWTAGVTGVPIKMEGCDITRGRGQRYIVDRYNRIKGLDSVYAIGDIAIIEDDPAYPTGHPQLAQVAIQQARNLARNLNSGRFDREFEYHDKGSMATIGRNRAVADIRGMHLYGRTAWMAWMFVHLVSLLGMRNKLTVLINWTWAYFSYSSSLRLLIRPNRYPLRTRWGER